MKVKLPIIGQVRTGSDAQPTEIIKEVVKKEKLYDVLGGVVDLSPSSLSNHKTISSKLLQANKGWVYRNNDVIAQEVSKIDFELFTIGLSKGEIVFNQVNSHPLLDLLDNPNDETTKSDALYIIQSHKKLTGDAFWLKIRNGQQVVGLRSIPPDKVKLNLRQPTPDDPTVIESFIYEDSIDGQPVKAIYDPQDIIHFKKPNPNNPFRGYGTVEALAETIDHDNLTLDVLNNFLKNGAIHNFALSTDQKITPEQLTRLKAELKSTLNGPQNAFTVPIFGGGLEPKDISYSSKEQQLLEQQGWDRDKIMVGFGNTKASLGIIDDVNRASHESSLIEWKRNSVVPDMAAIVNTLNEFLVPEFGQNLVLGFADPVPEDRDDDVKEASRLYGSGVISLNEARDLLDYDEVPDGDKFREPSGPLANGFEGADNEEDA
jgi:HK97 family phage portal protein